ncbi:hypothetical protein A0H81_01037 [Grifola frondosa]|uniref:Uncharacterized protein n=1 Tax=Grifola frondosa TaxID=5627 RepID=A0A1C7MPV0_GRIFR|nr:hypothetical protein A0H81_01037 [Grifola frondosa]
MMYICGLFLVPLHEFVSIITLDRKPPNSRGDEIDSKAISCDVFGKAGVNYAHPFGNLASLIFNCTPQTSQRCPGWCQSKVNLLRSLSATELDQKLPAQSLASLQREAIGARESDEAARPIALGEQRSEIGTSTRRGVEVGSTVVGIGAHDAVGLWGAALGVCSVNEIEVMRLRSSTGGHAAGVEGRWVKKIGRTSATPPPIHQDIVRLDSLIILASFSTAFDIRCCTDVLQQINRSSLVSSVSVASTSAF